MPSLQFRRIEGFGGKAKLVVSNEGGVKFCVLPPAGSP